MESTMVSKRLEEEVGKDAKMEMKCVSVDEHP